MTTGGITASSIGDAIRPVHTNGQKKTAVGTSPGRPGELSDDRRIHLHHLHGGEDDPHHHD